MKSVFSVAWLGCVTLAAPVWADIYVVEVSPGIYRGPAPETAADYRQLSALGIRTVLDIRKFRRRQGDQECRCVHAHGMTYQRVPVAFHAEKDRSPERALRTLVDVRLHPIYIHCDLGRHRAGLIVGLYRVRCEGWSLPAAYCEMERFGFRRHFRGLERYFWNYAK